MARMKALGWRACQLPMNSEPLSDCQVVVLRSTPQAWRWAIMIWAKRVA